MTLGGRRLERILFLNGGLIGKAPVQKLLFDQTSNLNKPLADFTGLAGR